MNATSLWIGIRRHRDVLLFVALACIVPLWYTLYTKHIWEDFFITFRHSQNLAEGKGLVYNPGEKVHGFTSPLGTLLPALTYAVTGYRSYLPALWLFRVLSIAALCVGGVLIFLRLRAENPAHPYLKYGFALLFAFEAKSVAYAANGMETGFMLLFVGWGVHLLIRQAPYRPLQMGLCWAGLMWTRPDGFVPVVALVLANLVFFAESRRTAFSAMLKSGVIGAALYAPWFLWAWNYYGSPVPHTVMAKGQSAQETRVNEIAHRIYSNYPLRAAQAFAPIYYPGAWVKPGWVTRASYVLGVFCSIYWLFPLRDRFGRAASLSFFLMCLYFSFMPFTFPWYLPPATACGLIVLASAPWRLAHHVSLPAWPRRTAIATGLCAAAIPVILCFIMTARIMRIQEKHVEMGNRAQIGRWLKDQVVPNETVFLEPFGYIGYFSDAYILDYPGLASPRVLKGIKEKKLNFPSLIQDIQPDWVVLRPWELRETLKVTPQFGENYAMIRTFDVRGRFSKYNLMPGAAYMYFDSVFHVYKRQIHWLHGNVNETEHLFPSGQNKQGASGLDESKHRSPLWAVGGRRIPALRQLNSRQRLVLTPDIIQIIQTSLQWPDLLRGTYFNRFLVV